MSSSGEVWVGVEGRQSRWRGLVPAITVALVVSVTLNVLLARKIQKFNVAQTAQIADRLLKVGTSVPSISANRLDGQPEMISYEPGSKPTVLYVFTPPCSWCAKNVDNFKTLVEKESGEYRVIALSLSEEGLTDYVAKNNWKIPVYSGPSPETVKAYKLGSTPQTIVVSPEGKVLQDWMGVYIGEQKSQIEGFFHVSLPGLRELPKAGEAKN